MLCTTRQAWLQPIDYQPCMGAVTSSDEGFIDEVASGLQQKLLMCLCDRRTDRTPPGMSGMTVPRMKIRSLKQIQAFSYAHPYLSACKARKLSLSVLLWHPVYSRVPHSDGDVQKTCKRKVVNVYVNSQDPTPVSVTKSPRRQRHQVTCNVKRCLRPAGISGGVPCKEVRI